MGVVDEVDEKLPHIAFVAVQQETSALQMYLYPVPLDLGFQNLQGVSGSRRQVYRRVQHLGVFLDLREPDDVVDEKEQAFAFPFDHGAVFRHVVLFGNHAAAGTSRRIP